MLYKKIKFMEDSFGNIWIGVNPGDYCYENGWRKTVTQEALDCDCGKGMYCPYVIQERV